MMIELSHRDQFELKLLEDTTDPILVAECGYITDLIIEQLASLLSHQTGVPVSVLIARLWELELEDRGLWKMDLEGEER